jgi:hypothetical protein
MSWTCGSIRPLKGFGVALPSFDPRPPDAVAFGDSAAWLGAGDSAGAWLAAGIEGDAGGVADAAAKASGVGEAAVAAEPAIEGPKLQVDPVVDPPTHPATSTSDPIKAPSVGCLRLETCFIRTS